MPEQAEPNFKILCSAVCSDISTKNLSTTPRFFSCTNSGALLESGYTVGHSYVGAPSRKSYVESLTSGVSDS
jgi:hypothetical protein